MPSFRRSCLVLVWILLWPAVATAHSGRSVSYSRLIVRGSRIDAKLRIASEDLIELLALDRDRNGTIDAHEMASQTTLIGDYLRNNLILRAVGEGAGGQARLYGCAPTLDRTQPPEPTDSRRRWRFALTYRCGTCTGAALCPTARGPASCQARPGCAWSEVPVTDLLVRSTLFQGAAFSHQHHATAHVGGVERLLVFDARTEEHKVVVPLLTQIGSYLWHGVHHIWLGYDHLVFLLGLLLLGGTFKTLLKIVTSFTVAHSVTLVLAALGVLTLPSQLVEVAIALTIAYVGVENLFLKSPDKRWIITFFLGLIHGFGFAGALAESGLPTRGFLLTLFSFNVGVEVGQVVVVALVWPLLLLLLRQPWHRKVTATLSVGIAAFGLVLFILRTFFEA